MLNFGGYVFAFQYWCTGNFLSLRGHSLSKTTEKGHLHKVFVRDIPTSGSGMSQEYPAQKLYLYRGWKRHINIWHIYNFSVTPVTPILRPGTRSSWSGTRTKMFLCSLEKIQSRSKFSISIEIFNIARTYQSRLLDFSTKIGPRWVARSKISFSLEIFNLARNLEMFFDLWALWVFLVSEGPATARLPASSRSLGSLDLEARSDTLHIARYLQR